MKIIVIGAGIFGITAALKLSEKHDVTLVDANSDILQNASKVNHSRVHFGFHYPRSKATAMECLKGYELFRDYFRDAIMAGFPNYYMIEKSGHVTSRYYEQFCDKLKLDYVNDYPYIDINFDNIETSYLTTEPIFDYDRIKSKLETDIRKSNIKLILKKRITSKRQLSGYDVIINAAYFNINKIKKLFDLEQDKLRLQTVIIPIFKWRRKRIGLTIMDGKFCSVMPKGFNPYTFLLYHAKESIIYEIEDYEIPAMWYYGKKIINNRFIKNNIYDKMVERHINRIVSASKEYFTFLEDCPIVDYWQTVRALPINDNDERLSELSYSNVNGQRIISVLSGKISTCLLTANKISKLI